MKKILFHKPVHYREIIIGLCISIVMIVFGSLFDKDISYFLYGYDKNPYFSIIISGIAELPTSLALVFSACLMFFCAPKENKKMFRFIRIASIIVAIFGAVYSVNTTKNIYLVAGNTGNLKTPVIIIASILVAALTFFFSYTSSKLSKKEGIETQFLFKCAFAIFLIIIMELIIANILKYLASRPRPLIIFEESHGISFKNWYEWNPFYSITHGDDFKSLPSAHTASASIYSAILPIFLLMSNRCKNNRKLQVGAFYLGIFWGLITAYARMCAGAHFLSDTGLGLFISMSSIVISLFIIDIRLGKTKKYEEA